MKNDIEIIEMSPEEFINKYDRAPSIDDKIAYIIDSNIDKFFNNKSLDNNTHQLFYKDIYHGLLSKINDLNDEIVMHYIQNKYNQILFSVNNDLFYLIKQNLLNSIGHDEITQTQRDKLIKLRSVYSNILADIINANIDNYSQFLLFLFYNNDHFENICKEPTTLKYFIDKFL
jgi:hypothetical protein